MREYGKVYSSFWQSPEVRAMSEDGRVLALYLLTTPHGSMLGCFRMPDAYAAEDLQWATERVSEGFRNLIESQFVVRDEATKWVLIPKFLKWNQFDNPNVAKAAHRAFELVPDGHIKQRLAAHLLEFGSHVKDGFRNACETLSEPYRNKGAGATVGAKPIRSKSRSRSQAAAEPTSPGAAHPVESKAPTVDTWRSYAAAYRERYGAEPVRNATVNGQMAHLVGRLGGDEAPAVARFFVGMQRQDYIKAMHPVALLLRDAEGIRTAWATGRSVTATAAAMADRTQTNADAFAPLIAAAQAAERAA